MKSIYLLILFLAMAISLPVTSAPSDNDVSSNYTLVLDSFDYEAQVASSDDDVTYSAVMVERPYDLVYFGYPVPRNTKWKRQFFDLGYECSICPIKLC